MAFEPTTSHVKEMAAFGNGVALLIAQRFGPLTNDNCGHRIEALTTILIDWHAMNPRAKFDERAWEHLLVYAPEELLRKTLQMKEKNK